MAKKSFPVVIIFFIVLIGLFALGVYQQTSAQNVSKEINNLNEKMGNLTNQIGNLSQRISILTNYVCNFTEVFSNFSYPCFFSEENESYNAHTIYESSPDFSDAIRPSAEGIDSPN